MRRGVEQAGCLELVPDRQVEYFLLLVYFRVAHARQGASERFADVVDEVVVLESSVPQSACKDDKVGEKVAGPESGRVDVDGADDSRV